MGMTDRQVLFKVELPLAMSVILTGVRVAVVITMASRLSRLRSAPGTWRIHF